MSKTAIAVFAVVLVLSCVGADGNASAPPVPLRRVIAIGDVHGDLPQLIAVLQMAEVVDRSGRWIGNSTTTVVQVGDLLDRGPHDKEVMDYFIHLKMEAMQHGGSVVNLLGNHEVMNLASEFHYVHPESNEAFGGKHKRRKSFSLGEGLYGQLLRNFPVTHVEGRTLFVHAGLLPSFAKKGLTTLNKQAQRALAQGDFRHSIFGTDGPTWTRLLITDAMNNRCADVHETLRILELDRMVIGHTPQRDGRIGAFCDDRLLAIDVGMSKWMYGALAALEITHLDTEGKNVELREILPQKVSPAGSDGDDEGRNRRSEAEEEDDDGVAAVKNDPMLLQEMLDVLHEFEAKNKKAASHDEL